MKSILLSAVLLACSFSLFAADVPDEDEIKSMTDKSLLDWNKAVQKEDFSKFYKEDCSEVWQKQVTAEKLKDSFKQYTEQKVDISGAVKDMEATFEPEPSIEKTGDFDVLTVKGYYDTKPSRLSFQLKYIEEEDEWKLVAVNVKLKAED